MAKKKKAVATIEVGCAIVHKDGEILIAQRNPGTHLAGSWEFPGGKREADETFEACLVRELEEELGVCIEVQSFLCKREHLYPGRLIKLHFYICEYKFGKPAPIDCFNFKWVRTQDLLKYSFPPPDYDVIQDVISRRHFYGIS